MACKYDLISKNSSKSSENLLKNATDEHKKGCQMEAFTLLFECIRYNLDRLITLKTKKLFKYKRGRFGTYKELETKIREFNILKDKRVQSKIGQFYQNRTYVIHNIVFNKNFSNKDLEDWFEMGRTLNFELLREIKKIGNLSLYDEIIDK